MRVQQIRPDAQRGGRRHIPLRFAASPPPPAATWTPPRIKRVWTEDPDLWPITRKIIYFPIIGASAAKQYINILPIPSAELWFPVSVIGGSQRLKLFIAGVEVPLFNPAGAGTNASACQITSQTIGRATATLDVLCSDGSFIPTLGQTLTIIEHGLTLFAGCIDTIVIDVETGSSLAILTYHITALDKSSICDRRVVTAATYTAGTDVATVIRRIVASYLNGEGINTLGVPTDTSLGSLTSNLIFNYNTVTDAFNQIATLTGTVWWIDQFGSLFFSALANLPAAPFQVSATSGAVQKLSVTQSLSGAGSTSGYRNKQYVVTNLNVLPGAGSSGGSGGAAGLTETFTFANGQAGVVSGLNPSNVLVPLFVVTKLPISTVISITVNGISQTVYEITQFAGQQYAGTTDYVWFFSSTNTIAGASGQNQGITAQGVLAVPNASTIVVNYVPGSATNSAAAQVGTALSPTAPSGATFGTCGSGIFEAVAQVQNVSSQADLNAIAQAELNKSGGIPNILDFETTKPGLFVGQVLSVLFPQIQLPPTGSTPSKLLITKVTGTAQGSELDNSSFFTWTIEAVTNLDPGNWVTYYARILQQVQNPLPVLQSELKTFVLAPGGSLAAGVVSTNPQYMAQTGLATLMYGGFTDPPINQDAVITFTDISTNQIIGSITIPAGSTAQAVKTIPASAQIYGYARDQITCAVSYVNIGANPVNAANGTAVVVFAH